MREIAFIKQNKEKWLEFEQAIFGKTWSMIYLMHKRIIPKAKLLFT